MLYLCNVIYHKGNLRVLHRYLTALLLTIISCAVQSNAYALSSDWIKTDEADYRVIVGNSSTNDYGEKTLNLGVEYKLAPKWHTYWRTAGDAGVPLKIETQGSTNINGLEIKWPFPHRTISYGTLQTYTYGDKTTIPFTINVEDDTQDVTLNLQLKHMVCDEICIPLEDTISLTIATNHADASNHKALQAALKNIPRRNGYKGLSLVQAGATPDALTLLAKSEKGFNEPEIFIEQASKNFRFPIQSTLIFSDDKTEALFTIPYEKLIGDQALNAREITVTLINGTHSIEHSVIVGDILPALTTKKKVIAQP